MLLNILMLVLFFFVLAMFFLIYQYGAASREVFLFVLCFSPFIITAIWQVFKHPEIIAEKIIKRIEMQDIQEEEKRRKIVKETQLVRLIGVMIAAGYVLYIFFAIRSVLK